MATIRDDRESKAAPYGYVVGTDSFMSGWGCASEGRSLFAVAVTSDDEAITVLNNFTDRPEMKRPRFLRALPRLKSTDHLTIADRGCAARWFVCGAFR